VHDPRLTRRRLLELGLALPPLAALAGSDLLSEPVLAATPQLLDADDDPTPELTEGPYGANRSDGIFTSECLIAGWTSS
jgi:hypothetical protein